MPITPAPHHMPGIIKSPQHAPGAFHAKITAHIKAWADSVPAGTMVSIFQMLTYDVTCTCPPAGWVHVGKCPGLKSPVPLEIVMEHLFPPDGSPCAIPGVVGLVTHGPMLETGCGLIKYIQKIK